VFATLDPSASMANADDDALRALLADVEFDSESLATAARLFPADEPRLGRTDPDDVPDLSRDPYVRPGEPGGLGDHRLLRGSAPDSADVARLLDGARPRLLVADPPYGVQLDPTWRDGVYNALGPGEQPYMRHERTEGHRNTTISGDTVVDWSPAFALVPSIKVAYVWHAGVHAPAVAEGLESIGLLVRGSVATSPTLAASASGVGQPRRCRDLRG
jgi:hypothetical protein